jgi:hypothetical protein
MIQSLTDVVGLAEGEDVDPNEDMSNEIFIADGEGLEAARVAR